MAAEPALSWADRLPAADAARVLALAAAAERADRVAPLSDAALLRLRHPHPGAGHLLARNLAGDLAGYAAVELDPPGAEVVVAPATRGRGVGGALLAELARRAGPGLTVWAHGDGAAARALAAAHGFVRARTLWQLCRPLAGLAEPPEWPAGVTVRTFRVGADEAAWLAVNARAFADHPEQGGWTAADLGEREEEPWFDPAGFFLAERAGRVVGFHWTKVHGGQAGPGEVYVIGVDPAEQGSGLGRALLRHGLAHLAGLGLDTVLLYVDETNTAAMRLYERMGFARAHADVQYRLAGSLPA